MIPDENNPATAARDTVENPDPNSAPDTDVDSEDTSWISTTIPEEEEILDEKV